VGFQLNGLASSIHMTIRESISTVLLILTVH